MSATHYEIHTVGGQVHTDYVYSQDALDQLAQAIKDGEGLIELGGRMPGDRVALIPARNITALRYHRPVT